MVKSLQGPRVVPWTGKPPELELISVGVGSFWVQMAADEG